MAAIDKIYGSNDQYDEFYEWVGSNRPEIIKHFYPRDDFKPITNRPITNLPEKDDMWLLENCPLGWVTDRIKDQYDIG